MLQPAVEQRDAPQPRERREHAGHLLDPLAPLALRRAERALLLARVRGLLGDAVALLRRALQAALHVRARSAQLLQPLLQLLARVRVRVRVRVRLRVRVVVSDRLRVRVRVRVTAARSSSAALAASASACATAAPATACGLRHAWLGLGIGLGLGLGI